MAGAHGRSGVGFKKDFGHMRQLTMHVILYPNGLTIGEGSMPTNSVICVGVLSGQVWWFWVGWLV